MVIGDLTDRELDLVKSCRRDGYMETEERVWSAGCYSIEMQGRSEFHLHDNRGAYCGDIRWISTHRTLKAALNACRREIAPELKYLMRIDAKITKKLEAEAEKL